MNKNRYLTEEERYDIDYEFNLMLSRYKHYLRMPREFSINQKIVLDTTDIGVLTLFLREKNKKGLTRFDYFDYKFIK